MGDRSPRGKGKVIKSGEAGWRQPMVAVRICARAKWSSPAPYEPAVPHRLPCRLPAAAGLVVHPPAARLWRRGGGLARRCAAHGAGLLPARAGPAGRRHRAAARRRLAAAVRELREETGIEAPPAELVDLGEFRFEDNRRRITASLFAWRPPPRCPSPTSARSSGPASCPRESSARSSSPRCRGSIWTRCRGQVPSGTRQISRA